MRIKLIAIEDVIQGYYGWIVEEINNQQRFNYEEYLTAQSDVGLLLAHDVLEHGCRIEQPNLDELAALGAIFANRDWDFYNSYSRDNFPYEIAEQVANYLMWCGDEPLDTPCSSEIPDVLREHYENRLGEIEASIETEYNSLVDEDDYLDYDDFDWDAIHRLTLSYLAKGYNEVQRKESRYNIDFHSRWLELCTAINAATGDFDAEEAALSETRIYINFTYRHGIESITVYNKPF